MARGGIKTEILIEAAAWKTAWPRLRADIRALAKALAASEALSGGEGGGQFVVVLADDRRLHDLNKRFRGKDKPTNVLSFPDAEAPFGGIALSLETIKREAREQGKPLINHAKHMILHGFLHLLGHDHQRARDARLMEGLETAILASMSIPDPYQAKGRPRA
jgi:probable rRNA maturation factor